MAWVTPTTVATGDVLTASTWNQAVGENTKATLNYGNIFHLADEKTSGNNGGASVDATWNKRTLTSKVNTIASASVASSAITLPAGTYFLMAYASAYQVAEHKLRFQNTTDATTAVVGINERSGTTQLTGTTALLIGAFTISAQKTFELQHWTQTNTAGGALGTAVAQGDECYATCTIFKVS